MKYTANIKEYCPSIENLFNLGKCPLPAGVSDTVEKSAAICACVQESCLYGTSNTEKGC